MDNIAYVNPFRYRCYYYDTETNLYYLQSRYYDPNTGRFINADLPDFVAVSNGNLFSYCRSNPINNVDFLGYCDTPNNVNEPLYQYNGSNIYNSYNSANISYSYDDIDIYSTSFSFSRDWLALGIDIVATLLMPYAVAPYDVIGQGLSWLAKTSGISLVWNNLLTCVVPAVQGIFSTFFTVIRTIIWRVTGALISNTVSTFVSNFAVFLGNFKNNSEVYELWLLISMFFSFGSMIAGIFDLIDGNFDGKITIS